MHPRIPPKFMPNRTEQSALARLSDWNLLRSFLAVCETGTLTAAAENLGLSQPTLGRHIRELELLMGETLFDRLPGRMKPTARSLALVERLQVVRDGVRQVEQAMATRDDLIAGTVRITTSQLFGTWVLPGVLASMMLAEPLLQVEVQATDQAENLIRREADIAVRFFRPEQDDVIAVSLGHTEIGLFAHERFVSSLARLDSPADLRGRYIGGVDLQRTLEIASTTGYPLTYSDFTFRSPSTAAQLGAIEAGLGVGATFVPVALRREGLRRLFPEVLSLQVEVWLCAHDDLRRSARMKRVFDHLATDLRAWLEAPASRQ